jgi:dipeptidase D
MANMVESVFRLAGAKVDHSAGYPGWQPNTDSEIMKITRDAYKRLFNQDPEVKAIHAGLECGLFLQKYPYLDMISFGPTIKGAHTPEERINIETTKKFWDLLIEVIKNLPEEK